MKNILLLIFIALFSLKAFAQVSIIVNSSVSESSIKAGMLGKIYSLEITNWENGSKIVVVEQATDNNVKAKFYGFISKDPIVLKKEWLKKQITGEAKPPVIVNSDEDVIKKVSSTPGAVGYVKSSSINGSVKVVTVIQ